jgi:CheY-like chemotaxis protein
MARQLLNGLHAFRLRQHILGLPRSRTFGPQVLLVAITAYDSPADIEMARYAGFNWHFAKPARPSLLLSVLQNPDRAPLANGDGTPLDRALDGGWNVRPQRKRVPLTRLGFDRRRRIVTH